MTSCDAMALLSYILGLAMVSIGILGVLGSSSNQFKGDREYAFKGGLVASLFGAIIVLLGLRCMGCR